MRDVCKSRLQFNTHLQAIPCQMLFVQQSLAGHITMRHLVPDERVAAGYDEQRSQVAEHHVHHNEVRSFGDLRWPQFHAHL